MAYSAPAIACDVFGNLLAQLRSLRESPAERGDEGVVALARLCACGRLRWLGQRRGGGQPEADEQRQRFDGDAEVAFHARHAPVELVEPLGESRFLPLGGVGRQEGCDRGLRDQRSRLIARAA